MELITTHTHTCFTNHGEGTVEELVSAAVAAGVSTIAVTEHYPMTATFDPDRYLSMPATFCVPLRRPPSWPPPIA